MIIKIVNSTGKDVTIDVAVHFKRHELKPSSIAYVEPSNEQIEKVEVVVL